MPITSATRPPSWAARHGVASTTRAIVAARRRERMDQLFGFFLPPKQRLIDSQGSTVEIVAAAPPATRDSPQRHASAASTRNQSPHSIETALVALTGVASWENALARRS